RPRGARLSEGERPRAGRGIAAGRVAAQPGARQPLPAPGRGRLHGAGQFPPGGEGGGGGRAQRRRPAADLRRVRGRHHQARGGRVGARRQPGAGAAAAAGMAALAMTVSSNAAPTPASEAWYAVWTRNQYEPRVSEQLRRKHFEVFLPTVHVPSRRRDRRLVLDQPLFPGYVFLRFAPSRAGFVAVASTDGVVRV